jgi:GNAT superfamily N-acetyltransferase/tetratricopeptide (TPR) repeat protein
VTRDSCSSSSACSVSAAGSEPERGLLAATLIVKDEARVLGACLESIRDVVDEIVVVDTGSTDGSVELARGLGASVYEHPWTGDFAEARNAALERTSCRWILYIDADERLAPVARAEVERLLEHAREVAFRILLQPDSRSTPYREYRVWRHDPRIRFEGVIHEKVVPAIHRVAEQDGRAIGVADLLLTHVGYEGDQTHKHRRNLPLLRRQLELEPDNLFNLHHLARVLEGLGEPAEAEQALARAVALVRAQGGRDPLGALATAELIRLRHLRGEEVGDSLAEALRWYPENCLLVFIEGRYLLDHERYEEALTRFERLLATDVTLLPDAGPAYDTRIFGVLSHDACGVCLFRLGRDAEAAEAWGSAADAAGGDPAYAAKQGLARARARSRVAERDRGRAIGTLVLAFAADPVERWMYPDAQQYLACFPTFLAAFGGRAFTAQTVWMLGEHAAVALWLPPGVEPDGEAIVAAVSESVAPEKLEDLVAVSDQMEAAHPRYPHWYLTWLGVDPSEQGRGLGGALLARCLEVVDRDRLPAYLETPSPRSIGLYERHGFVVTGEARAGDCPPVVCMERPAQTPRSIGG